MDSLKKLAPDTVTWRQPRMMERSFELLAGDQLVGTLDFPSMFGSLGRAVTGDGEWTFKRGGFMRPRITVRQSGSETDIATLHMSWRGGGELELTDGAAIKWVHTSFWTSRWMFATDSDEPLIHFSPDNGFLKPGALLEIDPAGRTSPHLPMLAALGWYLMLLMAQDSAAGAAAVS